ncbi:putative thiol-disulfide oxidoreductase [Microlunatus phosphovorus NM-1]|uniref:Putative thiol-disulfide oxidoreductase n=1 Tax=Microlunatus phosphovorus (strain ATCC 700054 / DSM 10555 / JCM 9379 / NBRC 101784 / NCIMB 13414 / VKM Ac-1990 / NM-1) TaxID=1032480 RepID=F5XIL3_MICPN|nr:TlpA disulfide reductase family protein [Microlunatus phosphovorus]BAK38251.1 putative thiol-disulfide oxidoreductase [Microlunatus phosphovorus NM-1]
MAGQSAAPAGRRSAAAIPAVLVVLVVAAVFAGGCAPADGESVTRTGDRNPGNSASAEQVAKSLTWIPPSEREPAPVASGPALDGKGTVSSEDYPGKVVVINVWGSWCGPCRAEARDLADASRATIKKAAFVGINIKDNNPDTARAFVRAFDVPYRHIYDPDGKQLVRFAGTLPPNGIPATLIIDREGRIAGRVVGVVDKNTLLGLIDDAYTGR